MKNKIFTLFFIMSVSLSAPATSKIVETKQISTLNEYLQDSPKDSIVFLNVTGTLYKPSTTLSSQQWRDFFAKRVKSVLGESSSSDIIVNNVRNRIVNEISKKPVEEISPSLIQKLQERKIPLFGITQKRTSTEYAHDFGQVTSKHIKSVGIDLEKTADYFPISKTNDGYTLFEGILFTNGAPTALSLIKFLKDNQLNPSEILMVDNTLASLETASEALASTLPSTTFIGLHYTLADEDKAQFNPALGIVEFFALLDQGKVMTDEEASLEMAAHSEVDYTALLDQRIKALAQPQ